MNTARIATAAAVVALGLVAIGSAAGGSTPTPNTTTLPGPTSAAVPAPVVSGSSVPAPAPGSGGSAPTGGIGFDEAIRIALERAGGGQVTEAEWESEWGHSEWKIEVMNGPVEHDLRLDADTGAVLRHKRDYD